jgi:hypothetical protein
MSTIPDKAKPDTEYERLKLDGDHGYDCSSNLAAVVS